MQAWDSGVLSAHPTPLSCAVTRGSRSQRPCGGSTFCLAWGDLHPYLPPGQASSILFSLGLARTGTLMPLGICVWMFCIHSSKHIEWSWWVPDSWSILKSASLRSHRHQEGSVSSILAEHHAMEWRYLGKVVYKYHPVVFEMAHHNESCDQEKLQSSQWDCSLSLNFLVVGFKVGNIIQRGTLKSCSSMTLSLTSHVSELAGIVHC